MKNMININTMERFHSEIVAMLLSVWTKWEHFLLLVLIWILVGQWKVILSSIFFWMVNFLYLQFVSHIGSHQKRIWKVDLKQQVKFKSSLLLELLHRISVFSIVHETIDITLCSYRRGTARCFQVLLCQGLCPTVWERKRHDLMIWHSKAVTWNCQTQISGWNVVFCFLDWNSYSGKCRYWLIRKIAVTFSKSIRCLQGHLHDFLIS